MMHAKLRSVAAATMVLTTWTFAATAQEPPTTDPPTAPEVTPPTTPSDPTDPPVTLAQTTPESPILLQPSPATSTYDTTTYPNKPLLVTGFVLLGATYGASAIAAGVSDRESNDKLYYPVAGPWLALDDRDCNAEPCSNKTLDTTLLIGSGVLQGIGALSMVMSLFVPEKTTQSWYLVGNRDFLVAPVAGTKEVGAMATGRF